MQVTYIEQSTGTTTAAEIKIGACFHRKGEILMRVKPTSYILNSSVISDSLANGKILVCNLVKGTVWFIAGDEEVELVSVKCEVQKV